MASQPVSLVAQTAQRRVSCMAFSPDGQRLASGGYGDQRVVLLDAATGKELRRLHGHADDVQALAFSPDGKRIATAGYDKTVRVWEVETGKELARMEGHAEIVESVAFSPDGLHVLSGSADNTVRLWDAATGKELGCIEGHWGAVKALAFTPDGTQAVTCAAGDVPSMWDVESGEDPRRFRGAVGVIQSAAFSPDGRLLLTTSGIDRSRRYPAGAGAVEAPGVWDAEPGRETARLWDVETGREIHAFEKECYVIAAAFINGAAVALTDGLDAMASLYDLESGRELQRLEPHSLGMAAAAFSPDGTRVATGGLGGEIFLSDVSSGKTLWRSDRRGDVATMLAFSRDGSKLLAGAAGASLRVWDLRTGQASPRLCDPDAGAGAAEGISSAGEWAGGGRDAIVAAAFSADGRGIVAATLEAIYQWKADDPAHAAVLVKDPFRRWLAAFSADASRAIAAPDRDTALWYWEIGVPGSALHLEHPEKIESLALSAGGTRALTQTSDGTMRLWAIQACREMWSAPGRPAITTPISFSADAKLALAGAADGNVYLWEMETGEVALSFEGMYTQASSVALSADGKLMVTGNNDGTVHLWDIDAAKEIRRLAGHPGNSACRVAYSPAGDRVVTAGIDGTIRIWDTATGAPLCRLVSFSDGHWAVIDAKGRYDGSNGGQVPALHWVQGNQPLGLEALRERCYDSGLLAKYMGFNTEPLKPVG